MLIVGDYWHHEFREVVEWLAARCGLARASDVAAAGRWLRAPQGPADAIILACAHPGRFSQAEIEGLHRIAPLARLIALLGSWCEGETCSGRPGAGLLRVYWHEFTARLASELQGDEPSHLWCLPRTATDVERLELGCRPVSCQRRGLVAISAASCCTYAGLADAVAQAGYAAAWVAPGRKCGVRNAAAGIWDHSSLTAGEPLGLATLAGWLRPAPLLALLNFPRHEDWEQARSLGAAAALAKPFLLDDLLAEIARLTR